MPCPAGQQPRLGKREEMGDAVSWQERHLSTGSQAPSAAVL